MMNTATIAEPLVECVKCQIILDTGTGHYSTLRGPICVDCYDSYSHYELSESIERFQKLLYRSQII